ncbi:Pfam:RnaseH [Aspergillus sp. HF37]|nr:Pfam:RnaseH [Aspergillus sp. HF37]
MSISSDSVPQYIFDRSFKSRIVRMQDKFLFLASLVLLLATIFDQIVSVLDARFPVLYWIRFYEINDVYHKEFDPRPLPPWQAEPFTEIEIEPDRETARTRAETVRSTSDIIVYSDASGRQNHLDAAVVSLDNPESRQ